VNNIDIDPQFVGSGDYHLQPSSPCIDAGNNSAPGLPDADFEGDDRIINGGTSDAVDIGVDEYSGLLSLKTPSTGTIFEVSTLINKYQPSFQWINDGTCKSFTVYFSTSPTDFSGKGYFITKANIKGTKNIYTPSLGTWQKTMKSSNNSGSTRDIYWKVVGTKPDKNTEENAGRHFRIDDSLSVGIFSPADGTVIPNNIPPTFGFYTNFNTKFTLEISTLEDFSDSKKIKKFNYSSKDPNTEKARAVTLSASQWKSVMKLVGIGPTGYFRITATDSLKRATVSGVGSFTIVIP
jgi:hypothetical protein